MHLHPYELAAIARQRREESQAAATARRGARRPRPAPPEPPATLAGLLAAAGPVLDRPERWTAVDAAAARALVREALGAAADHGLRLGIPSPGPQDPPAATLRALARIAERTAGRTVPLAPARAEALAALVRRLACPPSGDRPAPALDLTRRPRPAPVTGPCRGAPARS
jgi:hypothetical protein